MTKRRLISVVYIAHFNDWYFKKIMYPQIPLSDFADTYFPTMALVNQNKIFDSRKEKINLGGYNFKQDTGYHFDATLFAQFLQRKFKEIKGTIIEDDVVDPRARTCAAAPLSSPQEPGTEC